MSTHATQPSTGEQARAVLLAVLMVTSVVAMSVSFTATVAADDEPDPELEFEEELEEMDGIEHIDSMQYDEDAGILFATGFDGEDHGLWAIDPDDQSVEWSVREPELDAEDRVTVNEDYVFVADPDFIQAVDRDTQQVVAEYDEPEVPMRQFTDIDADSEHVYVAGEALDPEEYGIHVLEVDAGAEEFNRVEETLEEVEVEGLAVNDDELALVSEDYAIEGVEIREVEKDPLNIVSEPLATYDLHDEYDIDNFEPRGLEYVDDEVFLAESNDETFDQHIRALSVDTAAEEITESWFVEAETPGDGTLENFIPVDDRWVYTVSAWDDDAASDVDGAALDRDDGSVAWSIEDDLDSDVDTVSTVAAGGDDETVDLYAAVEDPDFNNYLWGISDGIVPTEETSTEGTITTTVDAPHPDVTDIGLETNPEGDITETGVAQPDVDYHLAVELDGDLGDVDRVDVEMFRVDEIGDQIAAEPAEDEYYDLTIEFDAEGDATISSEHNSDAHLSATPVEGIDREADTDETVVQITFPEDVRPSANTQDDAVNDYSWEIETTPVNEDIKDEEEPETAVDSFEMGVLVDANLNVGEVDRLEDTAFPGDENVAHGPPGEEDAVELEASGNVEIGVEMSAGDLEHEEGEDTISADQASALAGQGHTNDDYDHENVAQLANAPVDVGASDLANGQHEEFRLWIDYPEDIEPGEYSGDFTFTVSENGAS